MYTISSKEDLVHLMQIGTVKLGSNDSGFIHNLNMLIAKKENITTNQVKLFDMLVKKYAKQLSKQGYVQADLQNLPWLTTIVPSEPKYTEAYVSIVDGKIVFRSPFNKKFVKALSNASYHPFKWNKEQRIHEAPYDTEALKCLLGLVNSCFPAINYCPTVTALLQEVNKYHAVHWDPTLVKLGDKYVIAATNLHLDKALTGVELSNDPACLSLLTSHGVKIDPMITANDPLLEFASSFSPTVDFKDVDNVVLYLEKIDCGAVFFVGSNGMAVHYRRTLVNKIKEIGIKVEIASGTDPEEHTNPVAINMSSYATYIPAKFKKFITMKNSLPVVTNKY